MIVGWMALMGCNGDFAGVRQREGDDPGECDDGADNDADSFFDCNDPDCEGSPACDDPGPAPMPTGDPETGDTGTAVETGDTGVGQPTDDMAAFCAGTPANPMNGAFVSIEFRPPFSGGCFVRAEGATTGTPMVEGRCVTLEGDWAISDESNCDPSLFDAIWTPTFGDVYHTFQFNDSGTELMAWVAHANRREGVPNPQFPSQFWVTEIDLQNDVDLLGGGTVTYQESMSLTQTRGEFTIVIPQ